MTGPSENLHCKNDQILSVNGDPLDLFDQPLLLDMIFLGAPQLCGGVYILFFCKVSFEKNPNVHAFTHIISCRLEHINEQVVTNLVTVFVIVIYNSLNMSQHLVTNMQQKSS